MAETTKPSHLAVTENLASIAIRDTSNHVDAVTTLMVATHLAFRCAGKLALEERDIKLFKDMADLAEIIALDWEAAGAPIPAQRKS